MTDRRKSDCPALDFFNHALKGIGQDWIPSITSHEMVHAWNVKRMRPAEMMPYRYDVAQPTPWLWVSEGITDYYGDIAVLRAGITDSAGFLESVDRNIQNVEQVPPVALEDASLSTWIHPTDGTGYVYYRRARWRASCWTSSCGTQATTAAGSTS